MYNVWDEFISIEVNLVSLINCLLVFILVFVFLLNQLRELFYVVNVGLEPLIDSDLDVLMLRCLHDFH